MNNSLYKCPICGVPTNYSSINHQPQPCLKCSPGNVNHIPGNVLVVDAGLPKGAEAPFYPTVANTPAPTPWSAKSEAYWHEQYQLMRERSYKLMGENSKQAERLASLRQKRGGMQVSEAELKWWAAREIARLERELNKANEALRFIAEWGGRTLESEYGDIDCNGKWCAEQAKEALK